MRSTVAVDCDRLKSIRERAQIDSGYRFFFADYVIFNHMAHSVFVIESYVNLLLSQSVLTSQTVGLVDF